MKLDCKLKVLSALRKIRKKEITKNVRYRDIDGMFCFNGMIGHLCGYEIPIPEDSNDYYDNIAPYIFPDLVTKLEMKNHTIQAINDIHEQYCDGRLKWSDAKEQIISLIKRNE